MKTIILAFCIFLPTFALAADEYDNGYCKDPAELQKWSNLLAESPDSDAIAAIHALWIGLCAKVEAHDITTERANKIFENFRWGIIIESIEAEEERSEKK